MKTTLHKLAVGLDVPKLETMQAAQWALDEINRLKHMSADELAEQLRREGFQSWNENRQPKS